MSLDAKGIQLLAWRIIRFSMNSFCKCVQKHPVALGVLFIFFLLYLFLPSVFFILVFTSPVLVGVGVFIQVRLNSKRQNAAGLEKKDRERPSADEGTTSINPSLRSQKSVRRNVRKENIECDAQGNTITLINPLDEILGRNSLLKEKHTTSSALDNWDTSSNNNATESNQADELFDSEQPKFDTIWHDGFDEQFEKFSGVGEVEVESMEEAEDMDEEEVQEDGNKAVEWTDDDQKNLMDLGISELERNERLESLIARRRARKLFKMAVEKSLMGMDSANQTQIAPIFVARSKPFNDQKNPDQDGLHIPSSAPSILLPGQNPFDLPYDLYEEKPNLTGDGFQQEFMAAHQKDIFFCRHESFCRGPFFPLELKHDLPDPQFDLCFSTKEKIVERPRDSTVGGQSDKGGGHEHRMSSSMGSATDLVQLEIQDPTQVMNSEELPHEDSSIETGRGKTEDSNGLKPNLVNELEVQTETDSISENKSSSSSSSEASEMILKPTKFPQVLSDHVQKNLIQAAPRKSPSLDRLPFNPSPTANDKSRLDNRFFFKASCHTPTYSVASDLQVEVSEGDSPRTTALADGAASFFDEDTVTYDADVDKDIISDNEEKWGVSFYQERGDNEKVSIWRKLQGTNEESTFDGLSDWSTKLEDAIILSKLSKQNMNSTISLSSECGTTENNQFCPRNINHQNNGGVEPTLKKVEVSKMSNASNESSPRSLKTRIVEDFMFRSSPQVNFVKAEELPKHQERFAEEAREIQNVEPIIDANASIIESKPVENNDGAHIFIEQEALRDLERSGEVINSVSSDSEYNPVNSKWSYDQRIMAYEKMMEDNRNFEYTRDREGDPKKLTEHIANNILEATPRKDILKPVEDRRDEQVIPENVVPLKEQRFDGSMHPRLGIEQVSVTTGSFPSPRTVLLQQIPTNSSPQHYQENSIDHFSSNPSFGNLEGQSDMMMNSAEESNNGPHFDLVEGKKDSPTKSTEGESKTTFISHGDVEEPLKPAQESNTGFGENIEETYENLTKHEGNISSSKSQQEEETIKKFTGDKLARNINNFCSPREGGEAEVNNPHS